MIRLLGDLLLGFYIFYSPLEKLSYRSSEYSCEGTRGSGHKWDFEVFFYFMLNGTFYSPTCEWHIFIYLFCTIKTLKNVKKHNRDKWISQCRKRQKGLSEASYIIFNILQNHKHKMKNA